MKTQNEILQQIDELKKELAHAKLTNIWLITYPEHKYMPKVCFTAEEAHKEMVANATFSPTLTAFRAIV